MITVHATPDPKDGWIEVNGQKVRGVFAVVASSAANQGRAQINIHIEGQPADIEVVWEDDK